MSRRNRRHVQFDIEPSAQFVLSGDPLVDVVNSDPHLSFKIPSRLVFGRKSLNVASHPTKQVVERQLPMGIGAELVSEFLCSGHRCGRAV